MGNVGAITTKFTGDLTQLMRSFNTAKKMTDNFQKSINKIKSANVNQLGKSLERTLVKPIKDADKLHQNLSKSVTKTVKIKQVGGASVSSENKGGGGGQLASMARGIVGGHVVKEMALGAIQLSDNLSNAKARLNLFTKSLEETERVQQMIMQSSQETRTNYQDNIAVVAKLGATAKHAFSSSEELVKFSELMNKNFKIGGASMEEQTASMYQLTQAMAAGKLQGDEFRSIMENAPMLGQQIAKYMDMPIEKLKEMSSEGVITADVIKNALFNASTEIEEQFSQMPVTFAESWTKLKNTLIESFQPLIDKLAEAANWIADNWSTLEPIFIGVATAVGVFAVAIGVASAATAIFNAVLNANPIVLIITLIATLIGWIVAWAVKIGGLKIAWLTVVDKLIYGWDMVKYGFKAGINFLKDGFGSMAIGFKTFGVKIANFMGDTKVAVLNILQGMVNGAIDIINGFIGLVNKIPGVGIDLIQHVSFGTNASIENEAKKAQREADLAQDKSELDIAINSRAIEMKMFKFNADLDSQARKHEIERLKAEKEAKKAEKISTPAVDPYIPNENANLDTKKNTQAVKTLAEKIAELTEQTVKQISIFTGADRKRVSTAQMLRDAKTRADAYNKFTVDMAKIQSSSNFSEYVKSQLAGAGLSNKAEIAALANATPEQQQKWNDYTLQSAGASKAIASITINISGNEIKDDVDIDKIANELLRKLKAEGY